MTRKADGCTCPRGSLEHLVGCPVAIFVAPSEQPAARLAAIPQDSTPAGLDALRRAVEAWTPQHSSACAAQDDDADCICGTSDVYVAALAVATPTGLDVERLTQALTEALDATVTLDECVEYAAAEYARLAATDPEAEGPPLVAKDWGL